MREGGEERIEVAIETAPRPRHEAFVRPGQLRADRRAS